MVATCEAANTGAWNGRGVQVDVRNRRNVVLVAMIQPNRYSRRESGGDVQSRLDVVTLPSASTDKRRRDQNNRSERGFRCPLRECVDQYRSAERVTDHNRPISKRDELLVERQLPRRKRWIGLVWHERITDLIARTELASKTFDELGVPLLVDLLASALNEQNVSHQYSSRLLGRCGRSSLATGGNQTCDRVGIELPRETWQLEDTTA